MKLVLLPIGTVTRSLISRATAPRAPAVWSLVRNTVVVRSNYKIMKFIFFYAERKLSCDERVSADVRSALAAQG